MADDDIQLDTEAQVLLREFSDRLDVLKKRDERYRLKNASDNLQLQGYLNGLLPQTTGARVSSQALREWLIQYNEMPQNVLNKEDNYLLESLHAAFLDAYFKQQPYYGDYEVFAQPRKKRKWPHIVFQLIASLGVLAYALEGLDAWLSIGHLLALSSTALIVPAVIFAVFSVVLFMNLGLREIRESSGHKAANKDLIDVYSDEMEVLEAMHAGISQSIDSTLKRQGRLSPEEIKKYRGELKLIRARTEVIQQELAVLKARRKTPLMKFGKGFIGFVVGSLNTGIGVLLGSMIVEYTGLSFALFGLPAAALGPLVFGLVFFAMYFGFERKFVKEVLPSFLGLNKEKVDTVSEEIQTLVGQKGYKVRCDYKDPQNNEFQIRVSKDNEFEYKVISPAGKLETGRISWAKIVKMKDDNLSTAYRAVFALLKDPKHPITPRSIARLLPVIYEITKQAGHTRNAEYHNGEWFGAITSLEMQLDREELNSRLEESTSNLLVTNKELAESNAQLKATIAQLHKTLEKVVEPVDKGGLKKSLKKLVENGSDRPKLVNEKVEPSSRKRRRMDTGARFFVAVKQPSSPSADSDASTRADSEPTEEPVTSPSSHKDPFFLEELEPLTKPNKP